jgi:hypothetical protein
VSKWIKAAHIQAGVMNFEFVIQYRSTGGNIDVGEEAGGTIFCAMLALDVGQLFESGKGIDEFNLVDDPISAGQNSGTLYSGSTTLHASETRGNPP